MGATPSQYAQFKRDAASAARNAGHYGDMGPVYIATQYLENTEGFSGDSLVERGTTVTDQYGKTATYDHVTHAPGCGLGVYVRGYVGYPDTSLRGPFNPMWFGLRITEH